MMHKSRLAWIFGGSPDAPSRLDRWFGACVTDDDVPDGGWACQHDFYL